jgi:hypothetical protein
MKIAPKKIIRFFDERSRDKNHDGSDVTAIIGFLGEDLLLGALQHFWKSSEGVKSKILDYKCTRGSKKGSRLDAWLLKSVHERVELYQVEVKNWAVYAIGGKELRLDATEQERQVYSKRNWDRLFAPELIPGKHIAKVLEPMKKPHGYENLVAIPLICFWFHIAESSESPYSKRQYQDGKEVHIFSASAYLRTLQDDCIDIEMPRAERRKRLLSDLIGQPK